MAMFLRFQIHGVVVLHLKSDIEDPSRADSQTLDSIQRVLLRTSLLVVKLEL